MVEAQTEDAPAKKRGFWAKVFGKGGKKDTKRDGEQKDDPKKKPGKSM
jgi:hypothetical protein